MPANTEVNANKLTHYKITTQAIFFFFYGLGNSAPPVFLPTVSAARILGESFLE